MSYFENLTPDRALETLGLKRQESAAELILPAIALFTLGAAVGAATALLLAPKSGRELRGDISRKASELKETVRRSLPMNREGEETEVYGELDH